MNISQVNQINDFFQAGRVTTITVQKLHALSVAANKAEDLVLKEVLEKLLAQFLSQVGASVCYIRAGEDSVFGNLVEVSIISCGCGVKFFVTPCDHGWTWTAMKWEDYSLFWSLYQAERSALLNS